MIKSLALSALGLLACASAQAQSLVTMETVGVWDIAVDPSIGNGCLLHASFDDGSDVRIGFDVSNDGGYLVALNDGWEGIEEGTIYPVGLDVDGNAYEGEGTGITIGGKPGVDIAFEDAEFLIDVARHNVLTLSHAGDDVMAIELKDSAAAIMKVIECQEKQR